MQTTMKNKIVCVSLRLLACAGSIAIASIGVAAAQQAYPDQPHRYNGVYQESHGTVPAYSRQDRADFDRSGTRGRMGLGASPLHPEGAGNPN
ncbi:hypothetical protein [Methyloferula stellata]|uniref:hypothetical protein n=1 Tax=Methyloferula stellata TaxID=876270 RepID=UPI00126850B1|nr:hypothetical protein [Methyloferula stellata]